MIVALAVVSAVVASLVLTYTVVAFVNWEYHPKWWDPDAREGATISAVILSMMAAILAAVAVTHT